jgi:flagellar hook-length control protein FliK
VPVDSARFLSRVAKAFTAAQQRDGEVRLRLSPPELGSLRLQVSVQDGVMVARMETETEAARTSLTNNLPALRERLAEQGIRVERFDIDLMQRPTTGTPDRPSDPQQQPEPQPFRSLRTNQAKSDIPVSMPSANHWSGQGRLNVII